MNVEDRFEGCGAEGSLVGVFLADFHVTQGPRIRIRVNDADKEADLTHLVENFDQISAYVIPKPQLEKRVISLNVRKVKVLGFPVIIEDKQYERNQFIFNVCFVVYFWSRSAQFESAIRKLADYLVILEKEHRFLSNEANDVAIRDALNALYREMNAKRYCKLNINNYAIELRAVSQKTRPPKEIRDWDVPIVIVEYVAENFKMLKTDITTQQILPHVNGRYMARQVAQAAGVDLNLVKEWIRDMVFHEIVKVVPVFAASNMYCLRPDCHHILHPGPQRRSALVQHGSLDPDNKATVKECLQFITSLKHGVTVANVTQQLRIPSELKIDARRLIQYLICEEALRRVNRFPFWKGGEKFDASDIDPEMLRMFDGHTTLDEIVCKFKVEPSDIIELIDQDANTIFHYR